MTEEEIATQAAIEAANTPPLAALERKRAAVVPPGFRSVSSEELSPQFKAARAAAGLPVDGISFKSSPGEVKASTSQRTIELFISHFGNEDDGGDILEFGSCAETIKARGIDGEKLIKGFFDHVTPIGMPVALEEHQDGVFMAIKVTDDPSMNIYLERAKDGTCAHGSMAYSAIDTEVVKKPDGDWVRLLKKIDLWEGSIVVWPMNRMAKVAGVKSVAGLVADGSLLVAAKSAIDSLLAIDPTSWDAAELAALDASLKSFDAKIRENGQQPNSADLDIKNLIACYALEAQAFLGKAAA